MFQLLQLFVQFLVQFMKLFGFDLVLACDPVQVCQAFIDPLLAFRESGYADRVAKDRRARKPASTDRYA